jgi:hypothetical protein
MINAERLLLATSEMRRRNPDGSLVYPKGKKRLHVVSTDAEGKVTEGWCCLGILSKAAVLQGAEVPVRMQLTDPGTFAEAWGGGTEYLCQEVREWYGFEYRNPMITTPDGRDISAAEWNDFGVPGTCDGPGPGPEPGFDAIADGFERRYIPEVPAE